MVHGVRGAGAAPALARGVRAGRFATGSCASPATRPRSERPSRTATSSRRGLSLCQDYLAQVADGSIVCRPAIAAIDGRAVTFIDGSIETVDAIVCATGYDVDIPYLHGDVWAVLGPDLALYQRTLHPDLPGFGVIGQFLAQGPYLPLLELQARWIVATWAGDVSPPDQARMRAAIAEPRPPLDPHNALATIARRRARRRARPAQPPRAHRGPAVRAAAAAALPARRPGRIAGRRRAIQRAARRVTAGARRAGRHRSAAGLRARTGRRHRVAFGAGVDLFGEEPGLRVTLGTLASPRRRNAACSAWLRRR